MASFSVEINRSAAKELRQLPEPERTQLVALISGLARDPHPAGVQKLRGFESIYRLRMGSYRVVYEIIDQKLIIIVVKVGHRKDVYRGLK